MAYTKSPQQVLFGSPISMSHEPEPVEMQVLLDEIIAEGRAVNTIAEALAITTLTAPDVGENLRVVGDGQTWQRVADATDNPAITAVDGVKFSPLALPAYDALSTISNGIYAGYIQSDAEKYWVQHNHLEQSSAIAPYDPVTSGDVPVAPLFGGVKQNHTNVIAYWYQDFGLEATRAAAGGLGNVKWYYWSWMFHGAVGDGYEPERHPWLGYYRGDDPNVLDWQCYWMLEAGVTGVSLQPRGTLSELTTGWSIASNVNHWIYQLLTNVPNFGALRYSLWANSSTTGGGVEADKAEIEGSIDAVLSVYTDFPTANYITKDGLRYALISVYEIGHWRGTYDGYSGDVNLIAMLSAKAAAFQAAGWGGIAIMGRNNSSSLVGNALLEAAGVLMYSTSYVDVYNSAFNGGAAATDYEDLAIGADVRTGTLAYKHSIAGVRSSAKSHSGHPSGWNWPGSTPALFKTMCENVLQRMEINKSPRIMTVYNVSEWAEAGPSLQPNMRDGKGYLAALRDALNGQVGIPAADPYSVAAVSNWTDFTPEIADAVSGGNVGTPSSVNASYYVQGKLCFVQIQMTNINKGAMIAGNDVIIRGLPFAAANLSGTRRNIGTAQVSSLTYNGHVTAQIQDSWTYLKLFDAVTGAAGDYITGADIITFQTDFYISICYPIA